MIGKELLATLWDRAKGSCEHCGKRLSSENMVIDRIFPVQFGGADYADNLRLLCRECNRSLAAVSAPSEQAFQQYLLQFLQQDPRFEHVESDVRVNTASGQHIMFDIVFTRTIEGNPMYYAVEIKSMVSATYSKIQLACQQLDYYRKLCPDIHFILAVPTLLAKEYHQQIQTQGITLWDREALRLGLPDIALPVCAAPDLYDELIEKLRNCPAGYKNWQVYQKIVGEILEALFSPPLDPPSEQNSDANYKNRRDYVLPNYAESGYWAFLRNRYAAEFIVVDAKNSTSPITKGDILQVAHYLKKRGVGLFGLIFSRRGTAASGELHLRDIWQNEDKMIVVLNDSDVEQMLINRQKGIDPSFVIKEKIQEMRQKV